MRSSHIPVKVKLTVSLAILFSLFASSCASNSGGGKGKAPVLVTPAPTQYKTEAVKKGSVVSTLRSNGIFVYGSKKDIGFSQVTNKPIKDILHKAGDIVKAGDVLLELDSSEIVNQLQQKQLQLQKKQLEYGECKARPHTEYELKLIGLDVDYLRLEVEALKYEMGKLKLVAPVSGRIVFLANIKLGEIIEPGRVIYSIADTRDIMIECIGKDADKFTQGMKVNVSYGGKRYEGEVRSLQNGNSSTTRIVLKNIPSNAGLGDIVEVSCELGKRENVIVLPSNLIYSDNGYFYVKILENGKRVERYIEKGLDNGVTVEVVKGLKEGDNIIVE